VYLVGFAAREVFDALSPDVKRTAPPEAWKGSHWSQPKSAKPLHAFLFQKQYLSLLCNKQINQLVSIMFTQRPVSAVSLDLA